jgi:vacuolar iron transporter family protein
MTSAVCFASGAALPTLLAALLPQRGLAFCVMGASLGLLLVLGGLAARLGGASLVRGSLRVAFWGAVAMGCTAAIGRLFGSI